MTQPVHDDLTPQSKKKITGRQRNIVIFLDRQILKLVRHWAVVISLAAGLYAGIPFLAPIAMYYGQTGIANVIYTVYGPPICHQLTFRSWFLFGEQTAYPRELAGMSGGSFEDYVQQEPAFDNIDVTTLNPTLLYAARYFQGSPKMGWKVAFCERDVAIYGSIAFFGLAFALLRRLKVKVPYLPFWAYLLIAIVPMGLDGFSQYFANPPFNGFGLSFYPIRESTPFLRTLTGAMFGLGNAWLAFPYIDDSMAETRQLVEGKLTRAGVMETTPTEVVEAISR
ncbi:MAG: DUF2085 domain-containing protein [Anaerolineae bacterium]|nr:DUF2085 domain-containing protein [Anaerolineae bacterium]